MLVTMVMAVTMLMPMIVVVSMVFVRVLVGMRVSMVSEMNVKFDSFDSSLLSPVRVQMISRNLEFRQLALQCVQVHAEINQRANQHVPADSAEYIEVKCFHPVCLNSEDKLLIAIRQRINLAGRVTGAKSIVYIDDCNPAAATIEHSQ